MAHKYGAKRTTVDGITFASKAETKRYGELKLLEKAGKVANLRLQPKFPLIVKPGEKGKPVAIGKYIADFSYIEILPDGSGHAVIEDVKGLPTALYRWKKKHFETQYGIAITEVR